jgi:hypothetical protein
MYAEVCPSIFVCLCQGSKNTAIGNGLEVFDDEIENSILHSKGRGRKNHELACNVTERISN